MTTKDEVRSTVEALRTERALKLALEALSPWAGEDANHTEQYAAYHAIREALAEQPAEQEPVAWMWRCKPYCNWPEWSVSLKRPADSGRDGHKRTEGYEDVPLYTFPPYEATPLANANAGQRSVKPWAGLTDEELYEVFPAIATYTEANKTLYRSIARAIEAKLRERNEHREKNA